MRKAGLRVEAARRPLRHRLGAPDLPTGACPAISGGIILTDRTSAEGPDRPPLPRLAGQSFSAGMCNRVS